MSNKTVYGMSAAHIIPRTFWDTWTLGPAGYRAALKGILEATEDQRHTLLSLERFELEVTDRHVTLTAGYLGDRGKIERLEQAFLTGLKVVGLTRPTSEIVELTPIPTGSAVEEG